ncbi:MAG: lysine--tRNA ligase [Bdellovibrionales bacterium RBG_16_40_8]|nr:MAG: lysine--tRNA ligase [Bdellovibrionales bacterium RBG_16_40_8]
MSDLKENPLRAEKRRKLHALKELGIDPYPHEYRRTHHAADLQQKFAYLKAGDKVELEQVSLAGRLMTMRDMGKAAFFNLQDQSGQMQIYLRIQEQNDVAQKSFKLIDLGDIVGVKGFVFKTQKGELSIHAQEFQILCKTLEPLPEKFHGLTDIEMKYRYRHLDLIVDGDSRKVFVMRSKIIREIRNFLDSRGFLEVETPVLQPVYGGAAAHPFETHHRALDMKLYLKISPEIYLKRLVVGGFEKVYEISKNFRNEGIDRSHNPEFTMLEYYEAYTDYKYQMRQFEELVAHVAKTLTGSMKVRYQDKEIDFTPPWHRMTVYEGIKKYAGIDPETISEKELFNSIKEFGSALEKPVTKGEMLMEAFELKVEEHLWQPTFVLDHPVEISPLTKMHREKKGLVERFEPFAACMEIGNAYTELNDPEDQLNRLQDQEKKRITDEDAHPLDDDFVHAIDVGMPPTGGVGIGVERIVMILTNQPSIRDIIFFPTMKFK